MADAQDQPASTRRTLDALKAFLELRTLVMLGLGFSAGLPNLLIFDTLSAWLRDAGLTLEVIGFFSLATLAYSFKFLWAPLVDRTSIPLLTRWLGHRRSWMLVSQAVVFAGLLRIATSDPLNHLGTMAAVAVAVGFASANQDIVIDAWRIEVAGAAHQGPLAAAYQWGYRIAVIVAGVVPLAIAEVSGWSTAYRTMSVLMLVGVAAVLLAPMERSERASPIRVEGARGSRATDVLEWAGRLVLVLLGALAVGSGLTSNATFAANVIERAGFAGAGEGLRAAWTAQGTGIWLQLAGVVAGLALITIAALPIPGARTRPGVFLSRALGEPLRVFFERHRGSAGLILALICVYRVSDNVLNIMTPFYLDLGFTKIEIAELRKVFGVAMSLLGVFTGGLLVARFGVLRALLVGAFAGPLSNLVFVWLAGQGADRSSLAMAIAVDNVAGGIAGTALIAFMSSLTSPGHTATQYALFSSLYALPGKLLASQSGRIVESAARSADAGGFFAPLRRAFEGVPPEAYATSVEKSGVSPPALGAGYAVFLLYSTIIGMAGVVLTVLVVRREGRRVAAAERASSGASPPA